MKVLSLFSGIGGIELGLEWAGMETIGQVEVDEYCNRILGKHWPDVVRYGDVRDLPLSSLPTPDLVCGGFPCQPVSTAGRRLGTSDPRWLWPPFASVVDALRPRYVLVENVPKVRNLGGAEIVADLAAMGYDAEWGELSAAAFGAPHLRRRFFLVGYRSEPEPSGSVPDAGSERLRELGERRGEQHGVSGQTQLGFDGTAGTVADTDGTEDGRSGHGVATVRRGRPEATELRGSVRDGEELADTERLRPQGSGDSGLGEDLGQAGDEPARGSAAGEGGTVADTESVGRHVGSGLRPGEPGWFWGGRPEDLSGKGHGNTWAIEPNVGRVAHGVPGRVDRLKALGNAVVPHVAWYIGERIMAHASADLSD